MKFVGFHLFFKSIDFAKLALRYNQWIEEDQILLCSLFYSYGFSSTPKTSWELPMIHVLKEEEGRGVGKSFGYHKAFPKLGLKRAPTWKKFTCLWASKSGLSLI
jgi:hypothetical protein